MGEKKNMKENAHITVAKTNGGIGGEVVIVAVVLHARTVLFSVREETLSPQSVSLLLHHFYGSRQGRPL